MFEGYKDFRQWDVSSPHTSLQIEVAEGDENLHLLETCLES